MINHTPGPWIDDAYIGEDPYEDPDAPFVQVGNARWMPSSVDIPAAIEAKANARLIAAAPEMLEALERVKATGVFLGAIPQGMVDAAIAKAKGE